MAERVTLQRPVDVQDPSTGEVSIEWETVTTLRAKVDGIKANERYTMQEVTSNRGYTVWIRWRSDVAQKWRFVWGSKVLDIIDVPDQQKRGRLLSVFCTEGLTDG